MAPALVELPEDLAADVAFHFQNKPQMQQISLRAYGPHGQSVCNLGCSVEELPPGLCRFGNRMWNTNGGTGNPGW